MWTFKHALRSFFDFLILVPYYRSPYNPVHICVCDGVSHWKRYSVTNTLILSPEIKPSAPIISVSLALEIYLVEGPTPHRSLGHGDTYTPITYRLIQSLCWHGWLAGSRAGGYHVKLLQPAVCF